MSSRNNLQVAFQHVPTGIKAKASGHRSQHRNRESALAMLRGQLAVGQVHPLPPAYSYELPEGLGEPEDLALYRTPASFLLSDDIGPRNST